jgi:DDE superfamily endonuclease
MEDVLDLYAEPLDEKRPLVGFDECPYQLVGEVRAEVPASSEHSRRIDYEYKRNGTCNLFVAVQPKGGWRHVAVTERRTKIDFAQQLKELSDVHFPDADVIRLVLDNLNTHTPSALYEAFPPEEARRLVSRFEFHYTPKHGRLKARLQPCWLNVAEIELSVLGHQCLDRRIDCVDRLGTEVAAWENVRNANHVTINWLFSTENARTKLSKLYPAIP